MRYSQRSQSLNQKEILSSQTIPQDEILRERTLNEYNRKIEPLQKTLNDKFETLKSSLYSSTPEDRRIITQKLLEVKLEFSLIIQK